MQRRHRGPSGLSPRGRGNLLASAGPAAFLRSIPAWAGEPVIDDRLSKEGEVYPRVGGGTR